MVVKFNKKKSCLKITARYGTHEVCPEQNHTANTICMLYYNKYTSDESAPDRNVFISTNVLINLFEDFHLPIICSSSSTMHVNSFIYTCCKKTWRCTLNLSPTGHTVRAVYGIFICTSCCRKSGIRWGSRELFCFTLIVLRQGKADQWAFLSLGCWLDEEIWLLQLQRHEQFEPCVAAQRNLFPSPSSTYTTTQHINRQEP